MVEDIKQLIRCFSSALSTLNLYSSEHQEFINTSSKAFSILDNILKENNEIAIGILNSTFVFEKELFFELSQQLNSLVAILEEKKISRIIFYKGLSKNELLDFIAFFDAKNDSTDLEDYFAEHRIANILAGDLKKGTDYTSEDYKKFAGMTISSEQLQNICNDSINVVSDNIESILTGDAINSYDIKSTIASLMTNLLGQHQEFLKLGSVRRYDVITFIHLIKVSVLAMHLASSLGYESKEIQNIGTAALFHDIGKIYISRKVLKKPSRLTEEEFKTVSTHTQLGAEIMFSYVDSLGILPVVVAFEHHLKENGLGYPKLLNNHKQHFVSKMVAICDVYDALSERRSYKDNFRPDVIYRMMTNGRGEHFNSELLDIFFKIVGMWPLGSIVTLSNKKIAIVRSINSHAIDAPLIEVIDNNQLTEKIDLSTSKTLAIVNSLNPRTDGEPFLNLI